MNQRVSANPRSLNERSCGEFASRVCIFPPPEAKRVRYRPGPESSGLTSSRFLSESEGSIQERSLVDHAGNPTHEYVFFPRLMLNELVFGRGRFFCCILVSRFLSKTDGFCQPHVHLRALDQQNSPHAHVFLPRLMRNESVFGGIF